MKIKKIEKQLNLKIRKNTVSLGIDVAEKNTGLCLLRTSSTDFYIEQFNKISILKDKKKNKKTMHQAVSEFIKKGVLIRKSLKKYEKEKKIVILEDAFLGFSVWTTKILSKFEIIAYLLFKVWTKNIPDPIMAIKARSVVGFATDKGDYVYKNKLTGGGRRKVFMRKPKPLKQQIKDWVQEKFNMTVEDDDLADAFILALNGLILDK